MTTYLLNGVLQIIEALICYSFYENITNLQTRKFNKLLAILCGYTFMFFINNLLDYNFVINAVVLILMQFLFARVLYKIKFTLSIFFSFIITCLVTITEFIAMTIISVLTGQGPLAFKDDEFNYLLCILLCKSLFFFVMKVLGDITNHFGSKEKTNYVFFMYPVSLLIVMINFILVTYNYNLANFTKIILAISSMFLILAVIFTCIFQQQTAKKEKDFIELRANNQRQEIETTYFELLEHQNKELQIFVHDTKNHLSNIYNLSENSDQAKEYINNIVKDIEQSNRFGKTSNKLLDLIIEKYSYICEKENIIFKQNIHTSKLEFIEDSDLTSIFNNLLDNAIEAAKQSKEKCIEFSINQVESMLIIDVTNSCDTKPVVKANNLISTKKDNGLHGFGFRSICKSVKKYSGDVEWDYDSINKTFNVSIIFNI